MGNGEMPQGIPPELMAQAKQGANMDNVNKAHQMLTGQYRMAA